MAGNTDKICVKSFRADWDAHIPIAALCEKYGITRDQLVRLKRIWGLTPRHDRRPRSRRPQPDPTPEEIAAACQMFQSKWDAETEYERRTTGAPDLTTNVIRASDIGIHEPRVADDE